MIGGGKVSGERWSTRVGLLRPGDVIRCDHYSGSLEYGWSGGEEYFVFFTLRLRDQGGFVEIHSRPYRLPKHSPSEDDVQRIFCIHENDIVTLTTRDAVPIDASPVVLATPRVEKRKAKKPKKGEQMKMFGDDD